MLAAAISKSNLYSAEFFKTFFFIFCNLVYKNQVLIAYLLIIWWSTDFWSKLCQHYYKIPLSKYYLCIFIVIHCKWQKNINLPFNINQKPSTWLQWHQQAAWGSATYFYGKSLNIFFLVYNFLKLLNIILVALNIIRNLFFVQPLLKPPFNR